MVKPHEEAPIAQCNGVVASDLIQTTEEPNVTAEKYTIEEDSNDDSFDSGGSENDEDYDKEDYGESKKRAFKRLPKKADSNRKKLKTSATVVVAPTVTSSPSPVTPNKDAREIAEISIEAIEYMAKESMAYNLGNKEEFLKALQSFYKHRDMGEVKPVLFASRVIDLFELFSSVQQRGGYQKVYHTKL